MLTASHVNAWYGTSHILHDVSISVGRTERVAVVGRNGAGKSTLLKSLMNAGPKVEGEIRYQGEDLAGLAAYRRARLGLQLVPEDRRIYHHLTVRDNIRIARHALPKGQKAQDPDAVLARFPMLVPLADRLGFQLSGGQQQVLALARALAAQPQIMLLDEPTEGVAPTIVEDMVHAIRTLCDEAGMGLVLCEQNLWFARQLTDRVVVMDSGSIVFDSSWADFTARPEIKKTHLAV